MKLLPAGVAILATVCGLASAAEQAPRQQVVFVCEHGNVKSLMAASYFNQLAAQRNLSLRAVSRGTAPDSNTVPAPIAAGLRADGVDVSAFHPAKIAKADVADALRVVAIGTDLPAGTQVEQQRVERWDDVPPASTDYGAARSSLKAHVAELLGRMSRHSAQEPVGHSLP